MGLGDMKVYSSLDQPFDAEIELIDANGIPLAGIVASLASPEDYHRVGLERTFGLNTLTFALEKKRQGQTVIHLRSVERISDPFIQLLVDLAWAKGQIYREYDVLLDPADYQLTVTQNGRSSRVKAHQHQRIPAEETFNKASLSSPTVEPSDQGKWVTQTYGPTSPGETIWQIAQQFKIPGISNQQLILAIVGMNKEAFDRDNVNGLRVGSRLTIPSLETIGRVPFIDAKREIVAHDTAWQTQQPIQHVIFPPYFSSNLNMNNPELESQLPSVPKFKQTDNSPRINSYLAANQDVIPSMRKNLSHFDEMSPALRAQMDITAQAIESVRETNALLKDQLHAMNVQNKKLQQQLKQRDEELKLIHSQIELLMRRKGIAGQVVRPVDGEESHWAWLGILVLLGAGVGGVYFAWRNRDKFHVLNSMLLKKPSAERKNEGDVEKTSITKPEPVSSPAKDSQDSIMKTTQILTPDVKTEIITQPLTELPSVDEEDKHVEHLIIEPEISPTVEPDEGMPTVLKSSDEPHNLIEFDLSPVKQPETLEEPLKPIKSQSALDTLLALAKTYIEMGDVAAAQESLKEVLEHGNKRQIAAAKKLMKEL